MTEICLEIKNLNKALGNNRAISGIDLSLEKGKKIALLGLNGAGKSSFIRLLVGESKPDRGNIGYRYLENDCVQTLLPQQHIFKKYLGYQSDTMLSIAEMTGEAYLILCGTLKGLSSDRVRKSLELIGQQWQIGNLFKQKMSVLSKGNLQKLAIAQAFMASPKWLFFDEPCQSLDPVEQDRFNQNIKAIKDIDLCVFSTHNVNHAVEIADEIVLIHQSKIAFHFKLQREHDLQKIASLLVLKQSGFNHQNFSETFNLKVHQTCQRIYQFSISHLDELDKIREYFEATDCAIEFCLPEQQAVMPLFRLLASGELQLDSLSSLSAEDQVVGTDS